MQKFLLVIHFLCSAAVTTGVRAAEASLPAPTNLQHDARMAAHVNQPVVILFSLPGCSFCKEVREQYLASILRELPVKDRPLIREVDMTSREPVTGFAGEALTHSEFASQFTVKVAPTVVFLDEQGREVAKALVGAGMAGFYGGYLDYALEQSRKVLKERNNYRQSSAPKAKVAVAR